MNVRRGIHLLAVLVLLLHAGTAGAQSASVSITPSLGLNASSFNANSFLITNTSSGAAGLFQHMPRYWPERARAIGMPEATPYDAEANVAASAWLVASSLDLGLDAWYFWSCKP